MPHPEEFENFPPVSPSAIVRVNLPAGCKKRELSVDALDRVTRELALKTQIEVDGKPLYCRSIKLVDSGNEPCLQIVVRPGSFELRERKSGL